MGVNGKMRGLIWRITCIILFNLHLYLLRYCCNINPAGACNCASAAANTSKSFKLLRIIKQLMKPPPLCPHDFFLSRDIASCHSGKSLKKACIPYPDSFAPPLLKGGEGGWFSLTFVSL